MLPDDLSNIKKVLPPTTYRNNNYKKAIIIREKPIIFIIDFTSLCYTKNHFLLIRLSSAYHMANNIIVISISIIVYAIRNHTCSVVTISEYFFINELNLKE